MLNFRRSQQGERRSCKKAQQRRERKKKGRFFGVRSQRGGGRKSEKWFEAVPASCQVRKVES